MIMKKMENDLFYNLRHLKVFRTSSKNNDTIWSYRWAGDRDAIEVYNKLTGNHMFTIDADPQLAEYICSLHNMSNKMINEVESKYAD